MYNEENEQHARKKPQMLLHREYKNSVKEMMGQRVFCRLDFVILGAAYETHARDINDMKLLRVVL